MKLFGFEIKRQGPDESPPQSFAPPVDDEGGISVASTSGFYSSYLDLESSAKTETDLVTRYRDIATQAEIETAIDEITNEAISMSSDNRIISIILDDVEATPSIKAKIEDEFENIISLLNFNSKAYETFRQWYIDGRLFFHAVVDADDIQAGIKELRYIDPRYIKKVKEAKKPKAIADLGAGINGGKVLSVDVNEYFVYSNKGFDQKDYNPRQALRIAKDSIVHVTSGLTDTTGAMVLSYLHKAIKPLNQLRIMEDATVIYRISRAPERRIFYIDVGNLPKMKAEQYLRDMMVKHKNRLVYDANSGEVRDDRKFMTMIEDYWIPRREGGRGTQIETLKGGENLGVMEDVEYFQKKLYNALSIPVNRLQPQNVPYAVGSTAEITRDELKFFKFINRLRLRFSQLFISILEKQLILKNILTYEDWKFIKQNIRFAFTSDSNIAEMHEAELLKMRVNNAMLVDPLVGRYISEAYVKKHILRFTDEDIEQLDQELQGEVDIIAQRRMQQAEVDGMVQAKQQEAAMVNMPQEPGADQGDSSQTGQGEGGADPLPPSLRKS